MSQLSLFKGLMGRVWVVGVNAWWGGGGGDVFDDGGAGGGRIVIVLVLDSSRGLEMKEVSKVSL